MYMYMYIHSIQSLIRPIEHWSNSALVPNLEIWLQSTIICKIMHVYMHVQHYMTAESKAIHLQ